MLASLLRQLLKCATATSCRPIVRWSVVARAGHRKSLDMRAAYICVLIAGLVDPSVASSQGTSSFGPSETAAIQQLFDGYTVAFRAEDYARLREYIQAPFVRFGPSNTRAETSPGTGWFCAHWTTPLVSFEPPRRH